MLQLVLAMVWLLDGVLQLQPFMFMSGAHGFGAMLADTAAGNPSAVAGSIRWNASFVDHHAVATNTAFAFVQILLGLGMAWRPSLKPALAASVVWSIGVWWFGEGLGGVLHGDGSLIAGGPGAVLFYAVLAVLLWPGNPSGSTSQFVAARAVGVPVARAVWVVIWVGLAALAVVGTARSPQGVHDLIADSGSGQPGWLAVVDRHAAAVVADRGLVVAVVLAGICLLVATAVFLPIAACRAVLVLAIVTAFAVWVVGQNFGMIFPGGATDPNSGPLLVLLALAYWPVSARPAGGSVSSGVSATGAVSARVV